MDGGLWIFRTIAGQCYVSFHHGLFDPDQHAESSVKHASS